MNRYWLAALTFATFLVGFCLTWWFRRYALSRQLLDIPNDRSSHSVATPRGGGIAIATAAVLALLVAAACNLLNWTVVCGMAVGGAVVAGIGFVEDHRELARRWRLLAHAAAAAWMLAWLGGAPPLAVFGVVIDMGWPGHALAALYVVWLINLTNFMDGIDGIAATETITVCLGGLLLHLVVLPGQHEWLSPLLLAAATLGFLMWNWPPAKIFMGDAGSGFLGFMLAALSLRAAWLQPSLFWGWTILIGIFVVDATVTILHRVFRAERFYEAHRSHAYQHAALRCNAHRPVTLAVGAVNMMWLLPIALLVVRELLGGPLGMAIAYSPLVVAAIVLRAGRN